MVRLLVCAATRAYAARLVAVCADVFAAASK
jgi:hypothetical protein